MKMKTAATAGVARPAVQSPARASGAGRMRGNPALTLLTVGMALVRKDRTVTSIDATAAGR